MAISRGPRQKQPSRDIESTFKTPKVVDRSARRTTSVRIHPAVAKYAKVWAAQHGTTMSDVIEQGIALATKADLESILLDQETSSYD